MPINYPSHNLQAVGIVAPLTPVRREGSHGVIIYVNEPEALLFKPEECDPFAMGVG